MVNRHTVHAAIIFCEIMCVLWAVATTFFPVYQFQWNRWNGSIMDEDLFVCKHATILRPAVSYRALISTKPIWWICNRHEKTGKQCRMFNYDKPHGSKLMMCYPFSGVCYTSCSWSVFCCHLYTFQFSFSFFLLLPALAQFILSFLCAFISNVLTVFVDSKAPC